MEQKEQEFGTIKMTKTEDGFRLDFSGDLAKCCCGCGPKSESSQSDSSCCSGDEKKAEKKN